MKKDKYVVSSFEVIKFDKNDVIVTSPAIVPGKDENQLPFVENPEFDD